MCQVGRLSVFLSSLVIFSPLIEQDEEEEELEEEEQDAQANMSLLQPLSPSTSKKLSEEYASLFSSDQEWLRTKLSASAKSSSSSSSRHQEAILNQVFHSPSISQQLLKVRVDYVYVVSDVFCLW